LKSHAATSTSKLRQRIELDRKAEEADADIKQLNSSLIVERATLQKNQAEERMKIADERLMTAEGKSRKLELDLEAASRTNQELLGRLKELERRTRNER